MANKPYGRGFYPAKGFEDKVHMLPVRKTPLSAGYDIIAITDETIEPGETKLIPTGLKAWMLEDEFLAIYIRSSLAIKRKLALANSVAIIDSDYFENEDNDGHIMLAITNLGDKPWRILMGDRIAQGVFQKWLKSNNDAYPVESRKGGIGSTGR